MPFERAAEVFAPQKGASPTRSARLTVRLVARPAALPRDPRGRPMTGAAGGLSGGLWAAFGARLVPGAAFVLGLLGFDRPPGGCRRGRSPGEGRLDEQSLEGKLVGEVARRCRAARVPLHVIAGRSRSRPASSSALGLASVAEAGTPARIQATAERIAGAPGNVPPVSTDVADGR